MRGSIAAISAMAILVLLIGCGPTETDQTPFDAEELSPDQAVIEPQADEALQAMCRTLQSAGAISFHVSLQSDENTPHGRVIQTVRDTQILMRRPDAIAANRQGSEGLWQLRYHGDKLTIWRGDRNHYAIIEVPQDIDQMLDFLYEEYDLTIPLAELLFSDPYNALTENVQTGTYVGRHLAGGRLCHHLLFTQENVDWQIWIDTDESALPRKVVITYKDEPGDPQDVVELGDWNLAPVLSDNAFVFLPPEGSTAVDLSELRGKEGE